MGSFCKNKVHGDPFGPSGTNCDMNWWKCVYETGKCTGCNPRDSTEIDCRKGQLTTEGACKDLGCFLIPPVKKLGGPKRRWKLPMTKNDIDDNLSQDGTPYLTMWAEGAGGLGEGQGGSTAKLVQYYRGMADFFQRVDRTVRF